MSNVTIPVEPETEIIDETPTPPRDENSLPLIHLPREDLYHGIVYVGSQNARLQVIYDTMLDETFLNIHSTDGNLIPSSLDMG
jgi:hypothetical protein